MLTQLQLTNVYLIVLLLENKENKNCMARQIPILCRNLTYLKFNSNFVTYFWALSVICTEHAESRYAHRIRYLSSCTETFRTVDIKYKSEITGLFSYGTSMSKFVNILSALL